LCVVRRLCASEERAYNTVAIPHCPTQVYHDPSEPIVDPETGKLLTSRPTAFGKYLNTKVGRAASMRTLDRVCVCVCMCL